MKCDRCLTKTTIKMQQKLLAHLLQEFEIQRLLGAPGEQPSCTADQVHFRFINLVLLSNLLKVTKLEKSALI